MKRTYDVSIEKDLFEDLPIDYNLTKVAHKHLITKLNLANIPRAKKLKRVITLIVCFKIQDGKD